jgi:hypothetical protein
MRHVGVLKPAPNLAEIQRLTHDGAQPRDLLNPAQSLREHRVDRHQLCFHIRVALPLAEQQVRLDGLATDIAQGRRDDGHSHFFPGTGWLRNRTHRSRLGSVRLDTLPSSSRR